MWESTSNTHGQINAFNSCVETSGNEVLHGIHKIIHATLNSPCQLPSNAQEVRVLLDGGADFSLISRAAAKLSGLRGPQVNLRLNVAGGTSSVSKEQRVKFNLANLDGSFSMPMEAITTKVVTPPMPRINFNPAKYRHLSHLNFANSNRGSTHGRSYEQAIHLLVSEPYQSYLMTGPPLKGRHIGEPMAQDTHLGTVLCGAWPAKYKEKLNVDFPSRSFCLASEPQEKDVVYKSLTDFWKLEHIGVTESESTYTSIYTKDEQLALVMIKKVSSFNVATKTWTTGMLWRRTPTNEELGHNRGRCLAIMRKNQATIPADKRAAVDKAYQDLIDNDFIEVVPKSEHYPPHFFYHLPSRPVIDEGRQTTKVRIIVNASCIDPKSKSTLNKMIYTGPCLLPHVAKMLLAFRLDQFIFGVDVSKMFMRVAMNVKDRDALRLVWQMEGDNEPTIFRLKVVGFGFVNAPFTAMWILHETARAFILTLPDAVKIIIEKTYMDDTSGGAESNERAAELLKQIRDIMDTGNFTTHKIWANSDEVLDKAFVLQADRDPNDVIKILGLKFRRSTDVIFFDIDGKFDATQDFSQFTRRKALSMASMLFDVLGFCQPFTLLFKLLLQRIHLARDAEDKVLGWDAVLPSELLADWAKWAIQVPSLKEIVIPRWLGTLKPEEGFLAIFCDASKKAYGICIYYVIPKLSSTLVFSKARVAPKDLRNLSKHPEQTIARLELLGLVCGARAGDYVANAMNLDTSTNVYFTDSLLNLQRVQKGSLNWKGWTVPRVEVVEEFSDVHQWRFVPGKINPADICSRGMNLSELIDNNMWWHGPGFILKDREDWPQQPVSAMSKTDKDIAEAEAKVLPMYNAINMFVSNHDELSVVPRTFRRQGTWNKAVKNIAILLRYKMYIIAKKRETEMIMGPVRCADIWAAEKEAFKWNQRHSFASEIDSLSSGNDEVNRGSPLSRLTPQLDSEGIIRFISRKPGYHPLILARDEISKAYLLHLHVSDLHAGVSTVHLAARRRVWILGGKAVPSSVIHHCRAPKCAQPKPVSMRMAELPADRLKSTTPWSIVACDYFGPMTIKIGERRVRKDGRAEDTVPMVRKLSKKKKGKKEDDEYRTEIITTKVWGSLFTCFYTRAVHCEMVEGCSGEAFVLAFRRFIARRGCPTKVYSDNARNFMAASTELKKILREIDWSYVQSQVGAEKHIEWEFAISRAPWYSGIIERMIRTFKRSLRVLSHRKLFTGPELHTLLVECERVVNSRPLYAIMEADIESLQPVTPFELVTGRHPEADLEVDESNPPAYRSMWRERQEFLDKFAKVWRKHYLDSLSVRSNWHRRGEAQLFKDDVVLLKDDTCKRNDWTLGRVIEVYCDIKGDVRSALLQLTNRERVTRSARHIAVIESAFKTRDRVSIPEMTKRPSNTPIQTHPIVPPSKTRAIAKAIDTSSGTQAMTAASSLSLDESSNTRKRTSASRLDESSKSRKRTSVQKSPTAVRRSDRVKALRRQ